MTSVTRDDGAGETLPPVVVLVGPTAVGKSRLAMDLADRFGGDIVTADSRQVYRYMDIGTAKPSSEERAKVPHFMLDLVAPDDTYSVERFRREGRRVLRRSHADGRLPLVVGGTGFYVQALLDDLFLPHVSPNDTLRARLRADIEEHGSVALHARLQDLDPHSAARIHPNNAPRVIRALEIIDALGGPVPPHRVRPLAPALYLGLHMDRRALHDVADRRVLTQFAAGLLHETEMLLAMGFDPASPPLQGFGYREAVAHLQGRLLLEQAIEQYQAATRQYIRRQMTWFRRDARIHWIESDDKAAGTAAAMIEGWLSGA